MHLPTLITIIIIIAGVWYAIHTLRKNNGHPCSNCRASDQCKYCKEKKK